MSENDWTSTDRYRTYRIFHAGRKAYWRVYDHQENKVKSEHFGLDSEKVARMTADDLNGLYRVRGEDEGGSWYDSPDGSPAGTVEGENE